MEMEHIEDKLATVFDGRRSRQTLGVGG